MDAIELVEYDSNWPALFSEEKRVLIDVLAREDVLSIEHFGSTAVPGLSAKPIIDILISVPSVDVARDRFVSKLKEIDYVFWQDNPKQDRLFFVKGMPPYGDKRTHHVHVTECPSEMWSRVKFRDYLIEHSAERDEYASLKRVLAAQYSDDREAYTESKGEFIAKIMRLAGAS